MDITSTCGMDITSLCEWTLHHSVNGHYITLWMDITSPCGMDITSLCGMEITSLCEWTLHHCVAMNITSLCGMNITLLSVLVIASLTLWQWTLHGLVWFGLVWFGCMTICPLAASALLHASVTQSQFIPLSTRNVSGLNHFGGAALLQLHSSHIFYHIFSTISPIFTSHIFLPYDPLLFVAFYNLLHYIASFNLSRCITSFTV